MKTRSEIPAEGLPLMDVIKQHIDGLQKIGDLAEDVTFLAGAVNVDKQKVLVILSDGSVIEIAFQTKGVALVRRDEIQDCANAPSHPI